LRGLNNHDLDDGLSAGLFTVADVTQVPFVGEMFADVRRRYPDIPENRLIHEAVRDMIGYMVADVLEETRRRLKAADPKSADDIRGLDHAVVAFSSDFRAKEKPLRAFLYKNMYTHFKVNRMMSTAGRVVCELFDLFIEGFLNFMPYAVLVSVLYRRVGVARANNTSFHV